MNTLEAKFYNSTKNILENNLKIYGEYKDFPVVLVYDLDSTLSTEISKWYIKNLRSLANAKLINFDTIDKTELKNLLLSLEKNSTVILVQSTNFRLEDFRIRVSLHKRWVWCLEHNHLAYIKDEEVENYASAIEYKTPYYEELSNKLKNLSDNAVTMDFVCNDWSKLHINGRFEDMKQNTGNYEGKNRGWTFPIWENFTEAKNFDLVDGELSIYAYPDSDLQMQFVEPFVIGIKKSKIVYCSKNTPKEFLEILEMIKKSEDNEVFVRELGFWLNNWITRQKTLSDVNAYERIAWFHLSIWKKHGIYRKKFDRKISQRYHIDIFPDIKEIFIGDKKVFENEGFLI